MKYTYDPECEILAAYFILNDNKIKQDKWEEIKSLSQAIQNAVEDWFEEKKNVKSK